MSKKRTLSSTNNETTSLSPPNKRRRLSQECVNSGLDESPTNTITVVIHSQSGKSQQIFVYDDLTKISYFSNELSRWSDNKNDRICTISSANFTVHEVKAVIYYKTHNRIDLHYPFHRLPNLCAALDYFAEKVVKTIFENYLSDCVPAIKYQQLTNLKSLCVPSIFPCDVLLSTLNDILRQISHSDYAINHDLIQNCITAPIYILTSKETVTAAVFEQNMRFKEVPCSTLYDYPGRVPDYVFGFYERSADDLRQIWRFILERKIYLQHRNIVDTVYQLKYPKSNSNDNPIPEKWDNHKRTHVSMSSLVQDIMIDVLQIVAEHDFEIKHSKHLLMIHNILAIRNSRTDQGYNFMFKVIRQLLYLKNTYRDRFDATFGEDLITQCFAKYFRCCGVTKQEQVPKELQSAKQFTASEQYMLVECISKFPEWYSSQKWYSQMPCFIKLLIEFEYNVPVLELAHLWFPIVMKHHKHWIITELPNQLSLKLLRILIQGMCNYIVRNGKNVADADYFKFVNQYSNVQW
eukprot:120975_1